MAGIGERISSNGYIPLDGSIGNNVLWDMRARLGGYKSVMSLRYDEATCIKATTDLKKAVLPMLGDLREKDVLEIGTGVGRFTSDLATRARQVIGIDFTEAMLTRAKKSVAERNISLLLADATSLPLSNSSVDVIFEMTVYQHIVDGEDFKKALKDARRVLKPGGFMLLCGNLSQDAVTRKMHAQLVHRSVNEYVNTVSPLEVVDIRNTTCADIGYTMMMVR